MTPTLPLGLQLHILELALPPLVRRNLDERVRLCKAFSLVHRSWTKTAQRELHEYVTVVYTQLARLDTAAQERIAAAKEGGWGLKRLDINLESLASAVVWLEEGDDLGLAAIEEMWLTLHEGDSTSFGVGGLRRLHIFDVWSRGPPDLPYASPRQLTYLALHGISLDNRWTGMQLPSLRVLLLEDVFTAPHWPDFLPAPVELRAFACKAFFPKLKHDTLAHMPQLRHFMAAFPTGQYAIDLWPALFDEPDAETPPIRLPPRLQTLTCLGTSSLGALLEERTAWRTLEDACDELGTSLNVRLELTTRQMEDLDLEEWAYSVGA
ncbi:Proteophosphoglycan ppg4 [Rhodotorula toruloides ATCC 204091]|uniref:Proteophosphoglycan ppg4 n=1 Tax=Rhodotorula toruloides TaxID=5286 RepID=A0A0K3CP11_RHOTO|nr:Proteophosphoglycan ppg4 [Rhodotorula toruloides ATCC 204091]KAK4330672.1 Proteophosphoglycan ppg4 [Rhodotorula toruloides]PRQ70754.1 Proteophosphoglycan ppg4 [Rhodotorula toruloides]